MIHALSFEGRVYICRVSCNCCSMQDQPCTTQLLSRVISNTQPHLYYYLLQINYIREKRTFGVNGFRGKWTSGKGYIYSRVSCNCCSMQDQPCTTQLLSRVISNTQPHLYYYLLQINYIREKRTFGVNGFRGKWTSGKGYIYSHRWYFIPLLFPGRDLSLF